MTLTRWKLLTGMLGLAIGGVAATADPPAPVNPACSPRVCNDKCPAPTAPQPALALPLIPAQAVQIELPTVAAGVSAPPPKVDSVPVPLVVAPVAAPAPVNPPPLPSTPAEKAPKPRPVAESPALPTPAPAAVTAVPDLPAPTATPVKLTGPATAPELPPAAAPLAAPAVTVDPLPPANTPPQRLDPPAVPAAPAKPALAEPTRATATATANVRVVLHIGSGQPKFEVVSGDDTLLKVVSDKVDVKSPSEKGETMSALKASGSVRLSAPGCEGTCSELTVLPGSGDVELVGDVRVKCKQGKGETEIVASRLTFKLGAAPGYSVPEPQPTVNTSFNSGRR